MLSIIFGNFLLRGYSFLFTFFSIPFVTTVGYMYEQNLFCIVTEPDMPDHDLEPPRFSRRAFERLLNDWPAVRGMIMSGKICSYCFLYMYTFVLR